VLHNDTSVMPLYNLGADAARRGRRAEAMTWYRRAVAVDPRDVPTRNNLGVALLEEAKVDPGKIEEAVSQLRVAETLSPADAEIHKNLAMALERQGHAGDAAVEYSEALRLRPGWSLVERMLAVLRATTGDPTARDTAEAVRLAEDACARERALPSLPQCLDVLALTYAEAGRLDDAARTGAEAAALARAAGDLARAARSQQRAASYEERRQRRDAPKTP
jgi:Flp pilus assembly protein TadD